VRSHPGVIYPLGRSVQPGLQEDFDALPRAVAVRAMEVFVDVSLGEISGRSLDERGSTGDLSDCFKVYFDINPDIKPRYRLVYRLLPDNGGVQIISAELVAVGLRAQLDAYVRAATRLGRLADTDNGNTDNDDDTDTP
jgi:hypothetical protein